MDHSSDQLAKELLLRAIKERRANISMKQKSGKLIASEFQQNWGRDYQTGTISAHENQEAKLRRKVMVN